jgi:eukaryotic-like serine/threonine-protein kinase
VALSAGTRLGAYEITGLLGAGGMGEVYRATDKKLGREVAIKTLPGTLAADPDRLARFEREAKLLAALNHAHIAAVYGLDEHEGTHFLAMELVEGRTLEEMLHAGALPVDDALRLALQIAEALEAAHAKGVVHRDLKPANVMVTGDGVVKVLDFGLAKAFSGDPNAASPAHSPALSLAMTQAGLILGTAGYMSPEQASGQATDQRADVWAFGVLLYEMLSGMPLFSGASVPHILADVLRSEPGWNRLPTGLDPRLRQLLERCLAKEPRNRLHAIADARIEIEAVLAGPAAGPETALGRRSLLPFAAAAVVVAAATGAAGWYFKPAAPAQVVRFDHELPGTSTLRDTNFPVVSFSTDGRRIAYNTSDGVYVLAADQIEAQLVPGTNRQLGNVMISPDGRWLGYLDDANLQLVKLPIGGGGSVTLTRNVSTSFNGATWTDNDWIVYAEGSTVLRVSANGGEPEPLFDVPTGNALVPALLPDGDSVLYGTQIGTVLQTVIRSLKTDDEVSFAGGWARYVPGGYIVYANDQSLFAWRFDASAHALIGGPIPVAENITAGFGPPFDVSPSGSLVYVPAGAGESQDRTLAIVSPDGNAETLAGIPPGPYSSPRVSPDGTRVVMQTTEGTPFNTQAARIWLYDLSGETALRPLTPQSGKNFQPIWTPDGERVTFASDRDGTVSIYWQAADGSGVPERLTTAENGTEHWPDSWSPDGRTLVYQVVSGGDFDLWMLSLDSPDEPRPLVDGTQRQHGAVFSPDGRWLAYGSNEESPEAEQIYVQPFPPTGEVYQITRESGAFPVWSPDGTALSYRRRVVSGAAEVGVSMVQTAIVGGDRFAWRDERPLSFQRFLVFGGVRDYDVMPDGKRFVMVFPADEDKQGAAPRPRINVVLNWIEELEARLPAD